MTKSKEAQLYDKAMLAAAKAVYDLDPFVTLGPDGEDGHPVSFEEAEDFQPTYYHAAIEVSAAAVLAYMNVVIAGVRGNAAEGQS